MLFRVDVAEKTAREVRHVTLSELRLRERYDLQEWIIQNPAVLGEQLLVITSEFSGFDRTSERLDILALDARGVPTVVELKRSAAGTMAELQALRYAAYCSTMSLKDIAELLAAFESRRAGRDVTPGDAERRIREFVDDPDFTALTDKPRIILGAEEFSAEITSTVLWLRTFELDISCVRLRPYTVDEQLLLDSSVLIPLPEAREYQIRRDNKASATGRTAPREILSASDLLATTSPEVRPSLSRIRDWLCAQDDVCETVFKTLLGYRRVTDGSWVTWLQFTRYEARAAVRPEVEFDPTLYVRKSSGGWPIVRARSVDEADQVISLLRASMQHGGPAGSVGG